MLYMSFLECAWCICTNLAVNLKSTAKCYFSVQVYLTIEPHIWIELNLIKRIKISSKFLETVPLVSFFVSKAFVKSTSASIEGGKTINCASAGILIRASSSTFLRSSLKEIKSLKRSLKKTLLSSWEKKLTDSRKQLI